MGLKRMKPIYAAWGLNEEIKPGEYVFTVQALLIDRMKSRTAARFVWQRLDRMGQRFLYELLCANNPGKGVPIARVQKQLALTTIETAAIVGQLQAMYVLEEESVPGYRVNRAHEQLVRALFLYQECAESLWDTGQELFPPFAQPDREDRSLLHLLHEMTRLRFQHLARLCHVDARPIIPLYSDEIDSFSLPRDIYQRVADALGQAHVFFNVFRLLESNAQNFFVWLYKKGGKVTFVEAQTQLTHQGCTGNACYTLLETLEDYALTFDTLLPGGERVIFIHQDLLSTLQEDIEQYILDEQQHALLPASASPQLIEEGLPCLLYDLALCVGWSYQYVLQETRERKLPKKWQNTLRPKLHGRPRTSEHDDLYLDLLFSTARQLGLLSWSTREEEKPRYRPTAFLEQWQRMTAGEQTRRFLEWWSKYPTWRDVSPDGTVVDASWNTLVKARETLLRHLALCSSGQWYRLTSLLYSLWKRSPQHGHDFSGSHDSEVLSLREQRDRWMEKGEGQLYLAFLLSTLYEAGMISLGYEQANPQTRIPDFFQLTELGAAALREDVPQSEVSLFSGEQRQLVVQPNFEIVLFAFEIDLLYRLLPFTMVITIDRISRFTLTREALLRGLEADNHLEDILSFLTKKSKYSLPQNIVYSLRDWAKAYKEARVSNVLLIELLPETCEADLSRALSGMEVEVRRLAPGIVALAIDSINIVSLRKRLENEGLVIRQ